MNIRARIFGGKPEQSEGILPAKKPKGAVADTLDSVSVSRAESRTANTRGEDRHRLSGEQAQVRYNDETFPVELINLSGGGAMVVGGFTPILWDRVDLVLAADGVLECVVRWLKGGRVGLEFARETRIDCSSEQQAELLREVIARSFPDLQFQAGNESTNVESADHENRRERRHPLIWSGVIHHDYQSLPVRIRNISATGALVEGDAFLRAGAEPLLDLGDAGNVFATVAWAVGDQAGLKFQSPFDLSQLARTKPQVLQQGKSPPTYIRFDDTEDSASAEQWGRMSLGELREELEGYLKR